MRTTVDVPDRLYRQIKVRAALRGQTIKAFFLDAVREKLGSSNQEVPEESGWRSVFGKADPGEMARLQRIIDEEFSRVDAEGWK